MHVIRDLVLEPLLEFQKFSEPYSQENISEDRQSKLQLVSQLIWALANYIADSGERAGHLGLATILKIKEIISAHCKDKSFFEETMLFLTNACNIYTK